LTVVACSTVFALTLIVTIEPNSSRRAHTLRNLARSVVGALERERGATVYGYTLGDGTGNLAGSLSFELGHTFRDLLTQEELRDVLGHDASARVIISTDTYNTVSRPGRIVSEFVDDRRHLLLIAPVM